MLFLFTKDYTRLHGQQNIKKTSFISLFSASCFGCNCEP